MVLTSHLILESMLVDGYFLSDLRETTDLFCFLLLQAMSYYAGYLSSCCLISDLILVLEIPLRPSWVVDYLQEFATAYVHSLHLRLEQSQGYR